MDINPIVALIGSVLATFAFIKGVIEYSRSNKLKRMEYLEKLIQEFKSEDKQEAIDILDDFRKSEAQLNLQKTLRDHNTMSISDPEEMQIRQSFDNFLDFMSKIEYFLHNRLISRSELLFFHYYIERAFSNEAVMSFAKIYSYHPLFRLGYIMKLTDDQSYMKFNLLSQRIRYQILRWSFKK